jgi:hypothetical protein
VFGIGEVNMVEMLDEVITTIKNSLGFGLAPTLLVFVTSHVSIIGMSLAAEWACLKCFRRLCVTTNPSGSKRMNRVFVAYPFILRLECSRTESAEER